MGNMLIISRYLEQIKCRLIYELYGTAAKFNSFYFVFTVKYNFSGGIPMNGFIISGGELM